MDGWMDGESNKCWMVEEYIFDGWLDDRQLIGRMVGWMDRHPNDGWMDGRIYVLLIYNYIICCA